MKFFITTEPSFYKALLKLDDNWDIGPVEVDFSGKKVFVRLQYLSPDGTCPITQEKCGVYDFAPEREWRHLDTMQYQTWLVAPVPRVLNGNGKVSTIAVPWAGFSDRYTFLFSTAQRSYRGYDVGGISGYRERVPAKCHIRA